MAISPRIVCRLLLVAAICVVLTLLAAIASAEQHGRETATPRFTDQRLHVEARAGFGTSKAVAAVRELFPKTQRSCDIGSASETGPAASSFLHTV